MKHFIGFELVWFVVSLILAMALDILIRPNYKGERDITTIWVVFIFIGTGIYLLLT